MYLGIDLGTSSVKVVVMDETFATLASSSSDFTVSNPQPLWSEQDPAQWWQGTCVAMAELKAKHPQLLAQVKAMGLSGQQHGAVLLDKNNQVLRPAILWNDGRSMAECAELEQRVPNIRQLVGARIVPGFTAPKLLWVAKHEPDIFKQVTKVLLPKDYLRLLINGEFASDMSDASGTCWLNVAKREWSEELLSACDLNLTHMPTVYEGSDSTGTVLPAVAREWGIPATTIVAGGAGDNAAGAISVNVTEAGQGLLSLGTSGVYFIADDEYRANPDQGVHTFAHCLPNRWHQMNCHLSAASCLSWAAELVGESVGDLIAKAEKKFGMDDASTKIPLGPPFSKGEVSKFPPLTKGEVSKSPPFAKGEVSRSPPLSKGEVSKFPPLTKGEVSKSPPFAKGGRGDLLFLPYLTGERSPHNNPYARGALIGLTPNTDSADMMQAVLEGVALNFAEGQAALYQAGVKINAVSVVGGGARSLYWGKILASALQRELTYRKDREVGAALGAARLAWLAVNGGDPAKVFPLSPVEEIVQPNPNLAAHYTKKLVTFKKAYQALFSG